MALSIQNRITDQLVSDVPRYYYLYEPLPILVTETDTTAKTLFVDLIVKDVDTNIIIETLSNYAVYDINPGQPLNIDIIKIIQQRHDANVWKLGNIDDVLNSQEVVLSKYSYELIFKVNILTSNEVSLSVLPIIGGRTFEDFNPLTLNSFNLNDFQKFDVDISSRWNEYPTITTTIGLPDSSVQKVNISSTINTTGFTPCGGMLYWKSRLGGWMQWGFDIKTSTKKLDYSGNIETGIFDTFRNQINRDPYIETNYSSVSFSNTISLKSLSLSNKELNAVNSVNESPVFYYLPTPNGRLELMKLSSASVPINSLSNGGDFQVNLKNISVTDFKTR